MKLGMISLGCAKNLIDTELFLGLAKKYNLIITNNMEEADIFLTVKASAVKANAIAANIKPIRFFMIIQPFLVYRTIKHVPNTRAIENPADSASRIFVPSAAYSRSNNT